VDVAASPARRTAPQCLGVDGRDIGERSDAVFHRLLCGPDALVIAGLVSAAHVGTKQVGSDSRTVERFCDPRQPAL
jgi:hypothetical protein